MSEWDTMRIEIQKMFVYFGFLNKIKLCQQLILRDRNGRPEIALNLVIRVKLLLVKGPWSVNLFKTK